MTQPGTPALSAIVITLGGFDVIRRTVRHLHDQTARDQIELLIVTPSSNGLEYDPEQVAGFHSVRIIETGSINYTGEAHAAGVRAASAPAVIYVEEHSYPEPGWAEALIKAHDGPWDAVGGAILNANPGNMVSWASMLTDFGPWVAPVSGGEVDRLPPHHTSYKKLVLEEYGSRLAPLLEAETILIANLNKEGSGLYLEPGAVSRHVNVSTVKSYAKGEFLGGRLFGSARARSHGWHLRRVAYALAAPAIFLVRLQRVVAQIRRCGRQRELIPKILPPLLLGLVSHTVGEMSGSLFGEGRAAERRRSIELNRFQHVVERDRPMTGTMGSDASPG
jgi:hypothetical protein